MDPSVRRLAYWTNSFKLGLNSRQKHLLFWQAQPEVCLRLRLDAGCQGFAGRLAGFSWTWVAGHR